MWIRITSGWSLTVACWIGLGLISASASAQNEAFLRPVDSLGEDFSFSCSEVVALQATQIAADSAWVPFTADKTGTLTLAQLPLSFGDGPLPKLELSVRANETINFTLPFPPFTQVTTDRPGDLLTEPSLVTLPSLDPDSCASVVSVEFSPASVEAGQQYWVGVEAQGFFAGPAELRWHRNGVGVTGWSSGLTVGADEPGAAPAISLFGVVPGLIDPQPCPVVIPYPDLGAPGAFGFGEALVLEGDRLVAGSAPNTVAGRAWVFEDDGTEWTMTQELIPEVSSIGDNFGHSLAMKDDLIVVDYGPNGGNKFATFEHGSGGWVRTDTVPLLVGNPGAIAIESDRIAMGYPSLGGLGGKGAVDIYRRLSSGEWVFETRLTADSFGLGQFDEGFGYAVAMDGGRLAVSSPFRSVGGVSDDGRVVLFERSGVTWTPVAQLTDEAGLSGQRLGRSLTLEGDVLIASTAGEDTAAVYDLRIPGNQQTPHERFSTPIFGGNDLQVDGPLLASEFYATNGTVFYRSGDSWHPDDAYADCTLLQDIITSQPFSLDGNRIAVGVSFTGTSTDGQVLLFDYSDTMTSFFRNAGPGLTSIGLTPPCLSGRAYYYPGTPVELALSEAAASAPAVLVIGYSQLNAPFKLGTLVPFPDVVRFFNTDTLGGLTVTDKWPGGMPEGAEWYAQSWISDPAGPLGVTASNAVRIQSF